MELEEPPSSGKSTSTTIVALTKHAKYFATCFVTPKSGWHLEAVWPRPSRSGQQLLGATEFNLDQVTLYDIITQHTQEQQLNSGGVADGWW